MLAFPPADVKLLWLLCLLFILASSDNTTDDILPDDDYDNAATQSLQARGGGVLFFPRKPQFHRLCKSRNRTYIGSDDSSERKCTGDGIWSQYCLPENATRRHEIGFRCFESEYCFDINADTLDFVTPANLKYVRLLSIRCRKKNEEKRRYAKAKKKLQDSIEFDPEYIAPKHPRYDVDVNVYMTLDVTGNSVDTPVEATWLYGSAADNITQVISHSQIKIGTPGTWHYFPASYTLKGGQGGWFKVVCNLWRHVDLLTLNAYWSMSPA